MIIYCVRHGETNSNVAGIVAGRTDEGINQKGIAQAQELNLKLADKKFDAVYVSPMRRTIETAEIIVPEYHYIVDSRLAERDLSELKNYTIDELWQMPLWNSIDEMRTEQGAETFGSGLTRVRDFLADLKAKFPTTAHASTPINEPTILLITHSFISRCFWFIEKGFDQEADFTKFHHANDEIIIYHL